MKLGCVGGRQVQVPLVDAVAGGDEKEIAEDQRATRRHVVGAHVQLLDHVVAPDDVAVGRALVEFVGDADVLAGAQAVDRHALHHAAVGDDVDAVSLDGRRAAQALLGPVVDAAGGELVVDVLPEELAGGLVEAHEDAHVDRLGLAVRGLLRVARIARVLVVGADEDLAVGDDRAAVGARADAGDPLDVLLGFDVPVGRGALFVGVDHVARRTAAEHRQGTVARTGDLARRDDERVALLGRLGGILGDRGRDDRAIDRWAGDGVQLNAAGDGGKRNDSEQDAEDGADSGEKAIVHLQDFHEENGLATCWGPRRRFDTRSARVHRRRRRRRSRRDPASLRDWDAGRRPGRSRRRARPAPSATPCR